MSNPFPEVDRIHTLVFGIDGAKHDSMVSDMRRTLESRRVRIPYASMLTRTLGELVQVLSGEHRIDIVHLFNDLQLPSDVYRTGCIAIAAELEKKGERKPWVVFGTPELYPLEAIFHSRGIHVENEELACAVLRRLTHPVSGFARSA